MRLYTHRLFLFSIELNKQPNSYWLNRMVKRSLVLFVRLIIQCVKTPCAVIVLIWALCHLFQVGFSVLVIGKHVCLLNDTAVGNHRSHCFEGKAEKNFSFTTRTRRLLWRCSKTLLFFSSCRAWITRHNHVTALLCTRGRDVWTFFWHWQRGFRLKTLNENSLSFSSLSRRIKKTLAAVIFFSSLSEELPATLEREIWRKNAKECERCVCVQRTLKWFIYISLASFLGVGKSARDIWTPS